MSATSSLPVQSSAAAQPTVKASSQGILCMWHGLTVGGLFRLLAMRPPLAWSHAPRIASVAMLSVLNSMSSLIDSVVFGRQVRRTKIQHPPLFILGHWRSGTTMLHNLMCLDPTMTFLNLYQALHPRHFLLTENIFGPPTSRFVPATRPMDNIAVGWNEPQEDDIPLALDCGVSPYMMAAFNDRRDIYGRFFDPRDMSDRERMAWKQSLMKLMIRLTIRRDATIVTKNPGHTFRIPILLEMFPGARFIYIYRNPYDVYRSTMHLRKTMLPENSFAPARLSTSSEDTLFFYDKCIRTYEETKSLIPPGRLHELRFEDLEEDPLREMARIYSGLQLPGWDVVEQRVQDQMTSLKSYRKNAFSMDEQTMRLVYSRVKWVFDLYGYPSGLENTISASDSHAG